MPILARALQNSSSSSYTPSSHDSRGSYKATVYPNGEYTVGYVRPREARKEDLEYEDVYAATNTIYEAQYHWDVTEGYVKKTVFLTDQEEQLRFINSSDLSQPKKREFRPGLTSHAKRQIRQSVYLMQQQGKLGFYTFTIPSYCQDDLVSIHKNFKNITCAFVEKLKRHYRRVVGDFDFDYSYVIESQSKRASGTSFYFWHIHLVTPCYRPGSKEFWVSACRLREMWQQALERFTTCRDVNFDASVDSVVLRKNPSAYVTKYLSKGRGAALEGADYGGFILWGQSAHLRAAIKAKSFTGGDLLHSDIKLLSELIGTYYHHDLFISIEEREFKVGSFGKLRLPIEDIPWDVLTDSSYTSRVKVEF